VPYRILMLKVDYHALCLFSGLYVMAFYTIKYVTYLNKTSSQYRRLSSPCLNPTMINGYPKEA